MDSAHVNKTRKFGAYTLEQLKAAVVEGTSTNLEAIKTEVADRESGKSVHFKTPQVRRLTDEQYRRQQYDDQYDAEIRFGL